MTSSLSPQGSARSPFGRPRHGRVPLVGTTTGSGSPTGVPGGQGGGSFPGHSEVMGHGPEGLGWTIDWLPDGRLLVTGPELLCQEPDGSMVPYADMSVIGEFSWNDIVVDGRGNVYVTSIVLSSWLVRLPRLEWSSL